MALYKTTRPKDRTDWLMDRTAGVGSSEAASVLGVNPWQSAFQLWQVKTGKIKPAEDETNLRLSVGHDLENRVAATFEAVNGFAVRQDTAGDWIAYNPDKPYFRVSPDRLYTSDGITDGILEIKTTVRDINPDDIPMNYFCQVQYQMAVMGIDVAYLSWINMLTMGANFQGYGQVRIERNAEFCDFLLGKVEDFWLNNVKRGIPPEPTTAAEVAALFPHSKDKSVEITDAIHSDLATLGDLQAQVKALQTQIDGVKDRICTAFGDADKLVMTAEDGKSTVFATYKTQTATRVDTAKLKRDFPDIYSQVTKESTSRVLRLK